MKKRKVETEGVEEVVSGKEQKGKKGRERKKKMKKREKVWTIMR